MKTVFTILLVTLSCVAFAAEPNASPAAVCPVSGEKIGDMGPGYSFAYEGKTVVLCCKHCKKDFDKDPARYLPKQ